MFSPDINGYNRREVDEYISKLKSNYEKMLMEEKLKVLETERKLMENNKRAQEVEAREKNIVSMLESFKKFQAEGNRNIEALRVAQLKMIYVQLVDFLEKLNAKDPGILLNSNYRRIVSEIEEILNSTRSYNEERGGTDNDPMRALLNKMKDKKGQETPREVRIERVGEKSNFIKPVTQMTLEENDSYDNLVDKFLDTKPPEEQPRAMKIQSSGFDLKEAINPKDDLSEIMKAFDFYGGDDDE